MIVRILETGNSSKKKTEHMLTWFHRRMFVSTPVVSTPVVSTPVVSTPIVIVAVSSYSFIGFSWPFGLVAASIPIHVIISQYKVATVGIVTRKTKSGYTRKVSSQSLLYSKTSNLNWHIHCVNLLVSSHLNKVHTHFVSPFMTPCLR